ncbi:MAG: FadR family transcriptional regulator [Hamadaea sp.]|nr:FadR family transcriptional regulator [Hamadaea sp.]NUR98146.1 FadR family transcriptional regulator [Kribbellaceae bacterium]
MSAADQVLHDLRTQILSGRLEKGTRLPSEKELASHYDVSAPTIREAVRALSAMSLVEVRHGAGTFVTAESSSLMSSALNAVIELEKVDLPSIFEFSEVIYLKAVEIALREPDPEKLGVLRTAAETFHEGMTNDEFATSLRGFLTGLVGISHNKLLIAVANHLIEAQITAAKRSAERSPEVWRRIAAPLREERLAIVDALDAGDADVANTAVRRYMKRGHDLVVRHAEG